MKGLSGSIKHSDRETTSSSEGP